MALFGMLSYRGTISRRPSRCCPPPEIKAAPQPLHYWLDAALLKLEKAPEAEKAAFILNAWNQMQPSERFVFNKLITGGFRIGVSHKSMIVNALSRTL